MKVFYVLCPAKYETGGTELAHQLVDLLVNNGQECNMVYFENNNFVISEVPKGFQNYNIPVKQSIDDEINSCVVIPETFLFFSKLFTKAHLVFWWMSVDNYFNISRPKDLIKYYFKGLFNTRTLFAKLYHYNPTKSISISDIKKIDNNRILHVYQSKYASHMLNENKIHKQLPLSDYINSEFTNEIVINNLKEDIVLYNPSKGLKITQKIMDILPDVKFIALKGLSRNDLNNLFQKAKVYIDFGNHPGKDRLPREACINGCCIIVGKNGSASYFEDVPISESYKFKNTDFDGIKKRILDILENYNERTLDFDFYRNTIQKEKSKFFNEVKEFVNYINSSPVNF